MKNFDEKGNFNPAPKPEETIKEYFTSSLKVIYDFIGINKNAEDDTKPRNKEDDQKIFNHIS